MVDNDKFIEDFDDSFYIPEELRGYNPDRDYSENETDFPDEEEVDIQWETNEDEASGLIGDDVEDALDAPDFIEVISQTVRTSRDGRQVVDVILDVPDVIGAVKYEVRTTKNDY